jgi:hypothetical protein
VPISKAEIVVLPDKFCGQKNVRVATADPDIAYRLR